MDNIQVFLRIRPFSEEEFSRERSAESAVRINSEQSVSVPSQSTEPFSFDFVGAEDCEQDRVFEAVGKRAVEQCMQGYNGTIFAYGQTGSGKTFTMQGANDKFTGPTDELRGLIPRCFEYLFARISEEEQRSNGRVKYLCRASYIEIYNETIYDLLDPVVRMCALREDIKKGIFVDNVTEETVLDPNEAYGVFTRGTQNRHVSATSMNRESSRSHSVLMLTIQSMKQLDSGMTEIREARFNLVDLAGSERQKLANTTGIRLKEAANINKSLSALGKVINALVDVSSGIKRHVNYRDSKLTFLLRDSLGGNSVTFIIANVSPAMGNDAETISTMRFAQRAKMIQNKAVVNQDMQGNVPQLHAEIHKLKQEIAMLTAGHQSSAIATPTTTPPDDKELGTTQYLLILALRKLRESERQKSRYAEIAFELKESLDRQKLQLQQQSLILKLRTAENSSLRLATGYQSDAENRSLREEITALQSTLSAMPDASDLLVENLQLREQIELFQLSRSSKPDTLTIPDVDATAEALESLLRTNTPLTDLQSLLPVIPDHAEYDRLEESVRQLQHDVGEMEIQKNAAEFQLTSVEEDWQAVHDGCVELKGAATVQERERIIAHTLDNIVNEQPRATWMAMAEMYTNQQAHLFY